MDESAELRRVLLHLQSAHQLARVGGWEADLATDGPPTLYWSPEVHEIAGWAPDRQPTFEEFVGMVHPDDRPMFLDGRAAAMTGERPYQMDLRVILDDGEQRRIHVMAEVLSDGHGTPVRLVGAVQDQTEVIEGLRQLRITEVARRDLLQRLLVTADIERNRLARHLASGPIDRLVQLEQRLAAEIPEGASQPWVDALAAVRKAIDSLHQTLSDIQAEPSTGDLAQIVDDLVVETVPELDVTTDVAPDVSLRPPVQATMLRVVHEALHNVRKHASASRADVRWQVAGGFVHVTVTDDGRGFDVHAVQGRAGHLGIVSMHERLTALGGQLDIRSRPGRTVVEAMVPVG